MSAHVNIVASQNARRSCRFLAGGDGVGRLMGEIVAVVRTEQDFELAVAKAERAVRLRGWTCRRLVNEVEGRTGGGRWSAWLGEFFGVEVM